MNTTVTETNPRRHSAKQKFTVRRTLLTRALALGAAVLIIGALGFYVNRQVGNPISARLAVYRISKHYQTFHEGEGYVVGPAKYQYAILDPYVDGTNPNYKPYYICNVYKTGSADTGFLAVYDNGEVRQTQRASTLSGVNTYNRFKNRLNDELAAAGIYYTLGYTGYDILFADFYEPDSTKNLFDPENPVFKPDSEYDRAHLPLDTVVCAWRYTQDGAAFTDETLARELLALKETCDEAGLPFDRYTLYLVGQTNGRMRLALDVPEKELASEKTVQEYLESLSEIEKTTESANFYVDSLASRKWTQLNSAGYEVCAH